MWELQDIKITGNVVKNNFNSQDCRTGKSTSIFNGNTEFGRTTRLISAVRFNRIRYLEKPPEAVDTLKFYTGENFYLASIGISTRLYVQDKYIFNFGITEVVSPGRVMSLTTGYRKKMIPEWFITEHTFSRSLFLKIFKEVGKQFKNFPGSSKNKFANVGEERLV